MCYDVYDLRIVELVTQVIRVSDQSGSKVDSNGYPQANRRRSPVKSSRVFGGRIAKQNEDRKQV